MTYPSSRDWSWAGNVWDGLPLPGCNAVLRQGTASDGKRESLTTLLCVVNCTMISFQILFLGGVVFIIGFERTYRFFFQTHKLKGSAFFFGGILIVLIGWPLIGMLVECYGAFLLFG